MKDIVVGCITGYDFDKIKPWVNSLDRCGFTGTKAMICYNVGYDTLEELVKRNYTILAFKKNDEKNRVEYKDNFSIVVERFLHLWYLLKPFAGQYRYIVTTDVKDVVFQQNPITYKPEYGNPDDELVILGYLTDLHNQAIYGDFGNSRVILCFGNHEYLNTQLKKNLQYVDQYMNKSIYDFYGNPDLKERERILNPGKGDLIVKFACIFKVVVVIGDFMFMHGGLNNFNFSNIQKIEDIDILLFSK